MKLVFHEFSHTRWIQWYGKSNLISYNYPARQHFSCVWPTFSTVRILIYFIDTYIYRIRISSLPTDYIFQDLYLTGTTKYNDIKTSPCLKVFRALSFYLQTTSLPTAQHYNVVREKSIKPMFYRPLDDGSIRVGWYPCHMKMVLFSPFCSLHCGVRRFHFFGSLAPTTRDENCVFSSN